jgi:hypothetical protein
MAGKDKAEKSSRRGKGKGDGPKRAPSPYIIFCSEKRAEVKAANPDATFGEMGKMLGQMWAALDEKEKAVSKIFCFHFVISVV